MRRELGIEYDQINMPTLLFPNLYFCFFVEIMSLKAKPISFDTFCHIKQNVFYSQWC